MAWQWHVAANNNINNESYQSMANNINERNGVAIYGPPAALGISEKA
jgi:hypothetical protein